MANPDENDPRGGSFSTGASRQTADAAKASASKARSSSSSRSSPTRSKSPAASKTASAGRSSSSSSKAKSISSGNQAFGGGDGGSKTQQPSSRTTSRTPSISSGEGGAKKTQQSFSRTTSKPKPISSGEGRTTTVSGGVSPGGGRAGTPGGVSQTDAMAAQAALAQMPVNRGLASMLGMPTGGTQASGQLARDALMGKQLFGQQPASPLTAFEQAMGINPLALPPPTNAAQPVGFYEQFMGTMDPANTYTPEEIKAFTSLFSTFPDMLPGMPDTAAVSPGPMQGPYYPGPMQGPYYPGPMQGPSYPGPVQGPPVPAQSMANADPLGGLSVAEFNEQLPPEAAFLPDDFAPGASPAPEPRPAAPSTRPSMRPPQVPSEMLPFTQPQSIYGEPITPYTTRFDPPIAPGASEGVTPGSVPGAPSVPEVGGLPQLGGAPPAPPPVQAAPDRSFMGPETMSDRAAMAAAASGIPVAPPAATTSAPPIFFGGGFNAAEAGSNAGPLYAFDETSLSSPAFPELPSLETVPVGGRTTLPPPRFDGAVTSAPGSLTTPALPGGVVGPAAADDRYAPSVPGGELRLSVPTAGSLPAVQGPAPAPPPPELPARSFMGPDTVSDRASVAERYAPQMALPDRQGIGSLEGGPSLDDFLRMIEQEQAYVREQLPVQGPMPPQPTPRPFEPDMSQYSPAVPPRDVVSATSPLGTPEADAAAARARAAYEEMQQRAAAEPGPVQGPSFPGPVQGPSFPGPVQGPSFPGPVQGPTLPQVSPYLAQQFENQAMQGDANRQMLPGMSPMEMDEILQGAPVVQSDPTPAPAPATQPVVQPLPSFDVNEAPRPQQTTTTQPAAMPAQQIGPTPGRTQQGVPAAVALPGVGPMIGGIQGALQAVGDAITGGRQIFGEDGIIPPSDPYTIDDFMADQRESDRGSDREQQAAGDAAGEGDADNGYQRALDKLGKGGGGYTVPVQQQVNAPYIPPAVVVQTPQTPTPAYRSYNDLMAAAEAGYPMTMAGGGMVRPSMTNAFTPGSYYAMYDPRKRGLGGM